MLRTPIIAGNWKMNTTVLEAKALVRQMKDTLAYIDGVEKVMCPPFVSLAAVADSLVGSSIGIGAQNMHFEDSGAFTGEVSPLMLTSMCKYVILGHSERRNCFGETDELINRKVQAAVGHGLRVILCVGENLAQYEAGQTDAVVKTQLTKGLERVPSLERVVIAYEPVWAIGTGKAATAEQAQRVITQIRAWLTESHGPAQAQATRILYGGSVTSKNIAEFVGQPDIDGALVGGASLKSEEFISIVQQTSSIKGKK